MITESTVTAPVSSISTVPVLLRLQTCQLEPVDRRSLDFQARVGRPAAARNGHAQPCVLVLTRSSDPEVDELSLRLAAEGVPLLRLDSDMLSGSICWDDEPAILSVGGERFAPFVSWLRYFSTNSLSPSGDLVLDGYCRTQWAAWMAAATGLRRARAINDGSAARKLDRVSQLAAAEAVGLRVPPTVVTNDLAAAADLLPAGGDLVVKSLGAHCLETAPGRFHSLFPQRVTRSEAARMRRVEPAPVMVQAYVESRRELRVFVVGGEIVGFEVSKPTADAFWRSPNSIRIDRTAVPRSLRSQVMELARQWQLDVAGFDVLDTSGGPVFLEVNASCDWLVFERAARCAAVSELVCDLVARTYRAERSPDVAGAGRCA